MEIVVMIIMLLVCLSFVSKLTDHSWIGVMIWSVLVAIFILLTCESATTQSKIQIADWLEQPDLMLDVAVWLTMDVAFQICFCVLAAESLTVRLKQRDQILFRLCRWVPGLLIFPVLFVMHTKLIFMLTGADFEIIAWGFAGCLLIVIPLLSVIFKWLIPEKEIRLEMLFLINMLIASLGIVATVNGRTTTAGNNSVEWSALVSLGVIFFIGLVAGILYNKYITNKKISKLQ